MLQKAIARAVARIAAMLSSKAKVGEALTDTAASFAVSSGVKKIYRTVQDKRIEIGLQHMQAIHAHDHKGVNTTGHGVAVGHVYQGTDGQFYKHLSGDTWLYWNGTDWV